MNKVNINTFISYAHDDRAYFEIFKTGLKKALKQLSKTSWDTWIDEELNIGSNWNDYIQEKLDQANCLIFLVSLNFLNSDYIRENEFIKTLEREKENGNVLVVPIYFGHCNFDNWPELKARQFFMPNGRRYGEHEINELAFMHLCRFDSNNILIKNHKIDVYLTDLTSKLEEAVLSFVNKKSDKIEQPERLGEVKSISSTELLSNLPRLSNKFFGREGKIAEIKAKLSLKDRNWLISIEGVGGMGKSTLALEIAHYYSLNYTSFNLEEKFRAIIWISAKENELIFNQIKNLTRTDINLKEILKAIAITLKREDITLKDNIDEQKIIVYKIFKEIRILLIIDNFETINDSSVQHFLSNIPYPSKIIITTRYKNSEASSNIRLEGLDENSTSLLLDEIAESKGVELNKSDKKEIYEITTGVPLAMMWIVGRMSVGYSLKTTISGLSKDNDFTLFLFKRIISSIKETNAHKCIIAFCFFESSVSVDAISSITGLKNNIEDSLAELCGYSLVKVDSHTQRYSLFSLTKKYIKNVVDIETHSLYYEKWRSWIIKFSRESTPHYWYDFNSEIIGFEFVNLQDALMLSIGQADWDLFLSLIIPVCWYYNYAGLWSDLIEKGELGIRIAADKKNPKVEAVLRSHLLGYAYRKKGEFNQSLEHIDKAYQLYKNVIHDPAGEMYAIVNYAQVLRKKGTEEGLKEARKYYEQAENMLAEIDDKDRSFIALQFELGKLYRDGKEWSKAKDKFSSVLNWLLMHPSDSLNQSQLKGAVLSHLSLIEFHVDSNQLLALNECNQAIEIFEGMKLKVAYGPLYWIKAQILEKLNKLDKALEVCKEAIEWFERLGMEAELNEAIIFKQNLNERLSN